MASPKRTPTTTAGIVPMTIEPGKPGRRRRPRGEHGGRRGDHRGNVATEVDQDGDERADVTGHVECEAERVGVPPEERAGEDEVGRARDREELGQPLDDSEQRRDERRHVRRPGYDARTLRPVLRWRAVGPVFAAAGGALAAMRAPPLPCGQKVTIAAAM